MSFFITAPDKVDEYYQFSEELGQINDLDLLSGFYKELAVMPNDSRIRKLKLQCKLKMKHLQKQRRRDRFLF
jgi:hypothetical protein